MSEIQLAVEGLSAYESAERAKKEAGSTEPKAARGLKTRKVARRPQRSSGARSRDAKVICRYCGGDDLAPSFKKRGDARCRACFKQRYGSAARNKKTPRMSKTKGGK
jgi:hypothetical protein